MSTNEIVLKKISLYCPKPAPRPKITPLASWQKEHFDAWWYEAPANKQAQRRIDVAFVMMFEAALRRFG